MPRSARPFRTANPALTNDVTANSRSLILRRRHIVQRVAVAVVPPPFLPRRAARIVRSRAFAVALALASAAGVNTTVQKARADRARWGVRIPAVVADRRIGSGRRIHATDLRVRSLPKTVVPDGAPTSVDAYVGQVALVPIVDGQILTTGLFTAHAASPMALRVGRGRVGVTLETGPARPDLSVGSSVLVIASPDAQARSGSTSVQGTVVAFDDRFVTLAVTNDQAANLAKMMAGGPVHVALIGV